MERLVPDREFLDKKLVAVAANFAPSLEMLAAIWNNYITSRRYGLPVNYWDTYPERMMAITKEQVQAAAAKDLDRSLIDIVAVGDAKKIGEGLKAFGTRRGLRRLDYPQTRKVDHVDTYHGVAGARPVPLARGRQLGRDRRVGRGAEQGDLRLPRADPVPRGAQGAARSALQLPEVQRPVAQGRALLLQQERRPAEPERALRPEGPDGHARGADRSEHVVRGRHDAARRLRPRRRTASTPSSASRAAGRTGRNTA